MKKLLVAAIGAATAFGAFAEYTNAQRFEEMERTETSVSALGSNWSEIANSSNTYTIVEMETVGEIINHPDAFANATNPTNALSVKTTFGKPLSYNVVSGGTATNLESNLFFDSLVKFTVCDSTPDQTYDGAKIIMWLQENEAQTATNLYVRAGYLGDGIVTTNDYVCGNTIAGDFADKWHRVTIKAMPTISTDASIPGFAIFIDGGNNTMEVSSDDPKWAVAPALTEAAAHYGQTKIFPSIIQDSEDTSKLTLTCASFDGTGTLNDMVFTSKTPSFTEAEDYVAPRASIVDDQDEPISGSPFTSLAAAVDAANGLTSGTYTFTLSKGDVLDGTLAFNSSANIILDFAGFVLTNTSDSVAAISNAGYLTLTNSTVNVGGIYCADDGAAVSQVGTGALVIGGGVFNGDVSFAEALDVTVTGGSFKNDDTAFETEERESGTWIADGKKLQQNQTTGLYDVVDYVAPTCTITVEGGEHFTVAVTTNEVAAGAAGAYVVTEGDSVAVTYTADTGYTLSKYADGIASVSETATIAAPVATAATYDITYYNGETPLDLAPATYTYGVGVAELPSTSADTGYQFAGWYDNAGLTGDPVTSIATTATGAKVFYAKITATTYTITFVNEIGSDPASVNYTIESGKIDLPTATTENLSVQFDGWTNATITAAITNFTPTVENVGNITLYAAWSSTGSSGYDGGDGSTFTVDPGTVATVEAKTGAKMTDTVAGTDMTYAQAYALGLVNESTGDVADLETTIEIKNGKVVVGLSEAAKEAYTITLKVYEKSSLTADWPAEATQTITLGSSAAAAGFTPSSATSGFYKTEVSISNK